jgi:hypothetical protein
MADRKVIHANVSDDAHQIWQNFADENGVSITGLIEAIGQGWSTAVDGGNDLTQLDPDLVMRARKVDVLRRRR